jgi:hypothetical protein
MCLSTPGRRVAERAEKTIAAPWRLGVEMY